MCILSGPFFPWKSLCPYTFPRVTKSNTFATLLIPNISVKVVHRTFFSLSICDTRTDLSATYRNLQFQICLDGDTREKWSADWHSVLLGGPVGQVPSTAQHFTVVGFVRLHALCYGQDKRLESLIEKFGCISRKGKVFECPITGFDIDDVGLILTIYFWHWIIFFHKNFKLFKFKICNFSFKSY